MKWKGFTLVEMLIVLLMTSLLMTSMAGLWQQLVEVDFQRADDGMARENMVYLYSVLQADLWRTDSVSVGKTHFLLNEGKQEVTYWMDSVYLVRIRGDTADSMYVQVYDVQYSDDLLKLYLRGRNGGITNMFIQRGVIPVNRNYDQIDRYTGAKGKGKDFVILER